MKHQFKILFSVIPIVFFACSKNMDHEMMDETLSTADLKEASIMRVTLLDMHHDLDSLQASHQNNHQQHWDSMYHYHDSIFWYHHGNYSHSNVHDDHNHTYLPYHHYPKYHHYYPGHETDSLLIHNNSHHHDSSNYCHHRGHDLSHHHSLDSLELIHHKYH
ncbi:MAG: hypothetical protein PSX81_10225 [bacterium]|nr:hypothetical protein [bacterium]